MCLVIGEAEAEFKLLHQIKNESAHVDRILTRIEYLGQLTQTNLTLLLRQLVRIENFIDAIRDPVGVQYMGILQTRVVFVVQNNAQSVKIPGEVFLGLGIYFATLSADSAVFVEAQIILFHLCQLILDGEPACRKGITQMFEPISFPFNSFTECDDARAVCTISFDNLADKRVFLLQSATIEVKGMLFDLAHHYNN